jgi:diphthamide biosynthesis protein 3
MDELEAVLSARECCGGGKTFPLPREDALSTGTLVQVQQQHTMADEDVNLYDEIEIEDCFYDATLQIYHHPCPCGDRFEISIADMRDGEDIARCPSCSLMIRIVFDGVCFAFHPCRCVFGY